MNKYNAAHLVPHTLALMLSILLLVSDAAPWLSAVVCLCVNIYLVCCLFEAAIRSRRGKNKKVMLGLPTRDYSILLIFTIFATLCTTFAAMYQAYGKILHTISDNGYAEHWLEFLYFSMVTITTLGFGDFAPDDTVTRVLVMFQLLCGVVFLVLAVSLVSSRLYDLPKSV